MAPIQRKGRVNQSKASGNTQWVHISYYNINKWFRQSAALPSQASTSYKTESVSTSEGQQDDYPSGVVLSIHPVWPDLGSNQVRYTSILQIWLYMDVQWY